MMHLHPETVDLGLLPPKGEPMVGAGGKMAPQDATAEFGKKTMEAAVSIAVAEVKHRLANRADVSRARELVARGVVAKRRSQ